MDRRLVIAMTCVGLASLSCQITLASPGGSGGPAPIGVAANGSEAASPAEASGETREASAESVSQMAAIEREILEELRSRHTGLAEYELILLAQTIVEEAARHELDPALVVAVIHVESSGYHLAVSPVGALGLMQLLPSTGEELARKLGVDWHGPDSLFDPIVNVKLGTAYLRELNDRYQSIPTALAAYNWGPGRIDRRLRRGATVPSRYIGQVMRAYGAHHDAGQAGRS